MSEVAGGAATERKKRSILGTTLIVLPAQVVFRAVEAVLPLLLAFWFGRSDATDVYYFAWAVFAFAGSLVFGIYTDSALHPILAEERLARREGIPRLLGSLLAHTWIIGSVLAVLVAAFALGWFRIRYDDAHFAIAARMVVPFALYLIVSSTRTFFATVLAAERQFFVQPVATCAGMLLNVGILAGLHGTIGVSLIPLAALAGELVTTLLLVWFTMGAMGVRPVLCFDRPPALRTFAKLVASEVGGGAITRVNPIVDQLMAGLSAVVGAGTMLRYSGDVASLPTSILQASLLSVLIAHLADDFARGDIATIRRTVTKAVLTVAAILLVVAVALTAVRLPLLKLVFLHGEMDLAGVERMARLLPYHLVGLAPFGVLLVLVRAHIAVKNSRIMIAMGLLNAGCNLVFNLVLLRAIGLEGIALSTSCVQTAVAIALWVLFRKRLAELA